MENDDDIIEREIEIHDIDATQPTDATQPSKRKRSLSNSSDHLKLIENIAKSIKENQSKKLEIFQQAVQPQSELELFFAAICKTVEKFDPMAKAKLKIEISHIVSQAELDHLNNISNEIIYTVQSLPIVHELSKEIQN